MDSAQIVDGLPTFHSFLLVDISTLSLRANGTKILSTIRYTPEQPVGMMDGGVESGGIEDVRAVLELGEGRMSEANQEEITELLLAWSRGNRDAFDGLAHAVYARLSRLASSYLRRERADHTLDTGALVHEAFLRLIQQDRVQWRDRAHFFAISAKLMRRVLVDHARRVESSKRGGGVPTLLLDELRDRGSQSHPDLLALDDALHDLETQDADLANLVVLRYFGGLTHDEVAEVLDISLSTVARRWRTARAWLHAYLADGGAHVL